MLSWMRVLIQPLQPSDVPGSCFGKRQNLSNHLAAQVCLRGLIKSLQEENTGNGLNFMQRKDGTQCQRHCQKDLFLLEGSEGHFSF